MPVTLDTDGQPTGRRRPARRQSPLPGIRWRLTVVMLEAAALVVLIAWGGPPVVHFDFGWHVVHAVHVAHTAVSQR